MTELEYFLILNAISGLGSIRTRQLLEYFSSAKKVLTASLQELAAPRVIPRNVAENIIRFDKEDFLKKEMALLKKHGVKAISCIDENYPGNLKEIPDAPSVLYFKGTLNKDSDLSVALVGSRRASLYGLSMAEKLAGQLAALGITVVSGLARGIDTAAHQGALKAKGKTIAVLGNGLASVYPPENIKLFEEIAEKGAVLSEFPMTTPPSAFNFPRRNRIVSGLSLGVVVVEASSKSGALITSRCALEQGREVFAVPGKIDNPTAFGVNNLIKQGAKLISSVEDIIEELAPRLKNLMQDEKKQDKSENRRGVNDQGAEKDMSLTPRNLNQEEARVFAHLNDEAIHVDEVTSQSGLSVSQAMSVLLKLELKHLVRQLPGKMFVRT